MATFTQFSDMRFPPEIKDIIWIHTIANIPSRVIELHTGNEDTIATPSGNIIPVTYGFVANTPVPSILHVCSRSRELAMKRWSLTFASKYKTDFQSDGIDFEHEFKRIPRTWFDFEVDTLLFLEDNTYLAKNVTLRDFERDIEFETRKSVKSVAFNLSGVIEGDFLSEEDDAAGNYGEQVVKGLHRVFPNTRGFLVITGGEDWKCDLSKGLVGNEEGFIEQWEEEVLEKIKGAFEEIVGIGEVKMELVAMRH